MNLFKKTARHEEVNQKIIGTLCDKKVCLVLTHAACILMAANPELSPRDAVWDAYQVYYYLMKLKLHSGTAPNPTQ